MTAYFAMRGYFTFLIVLAACLLIVSLFQFNINSKYSNTGRAIWVDRYHQTEMNVKEAIVEAAREGVIEGTLQYAFIYYECLQAAAAPGNQKAVVPSVSWLKKCMNEYAYKKIVSLNDLEVDGMKIKVSLSPQYNPDLSPLSCSPSNSASICGDNTNLNLNNLIIDIDNLPSSNNGGTSGSSLINIISEMEKYNITSPDITEPNVNITKDLLSNYASIHIKGNIISISVSRDDIGEVSFTMPQAEVKIG